MARFDLNLIGALDALLTEKNVTRAAERVHVTQPTMSGMLQRLRFQFDDELLVRNGRGMEVTPFGQSLIDPVRAALQSVEALVHAEPRFDPLTSTRHFTVMASDYCASMFMPRVVKKLRAVAPNVRLTIQAINAPLERLMAGDVDLCISPADSQLIGTDVPGEKLQVEPLFADRYVCVVANDHLLREGASLADFAACQHVGVQMAGVPSTVEMAFLRQLLPHYRPAYIVPDFSLVPCMVAQGDLVGLIQERLAAAAAHTLPIRYFRPPFAMPALNEALLWHSRSLDDPSHAWIREAFHNEVKVWNMVPGDLHRQAVGATPMLRAVN